MQIYGKPFSYDHFLLNIIIVIIFHSFKFFCIIQLERVVTHKAWTFSDLNLCEPSDIMETF